MRQEEIGEKRGALPSRCGGAEGLPAKGQWPRQSGRESDGWPRGVPGGTRRRAETPRTFDGCTGWGGRKRGSLRGVGREVGSGDPPAASQEVGEDIRAKPERHQPNEGRLVAGGPKGEWEQAGPRRPARPGRNPESTADVYGSRFQL